MQRSAEKTICRSFDRHRTCGALGNGFTLIELLVVVAILAILVALGVAVGHHVRVRAMEEKTLGDLRIIQSAIREYRDVTGVLPAQGGDPATDPDPNDTNPTGDPATDEDRAALTSYWLLVQLREVPSCWDILGKLSSGDGDSVIAPYDVPGLGTQDIFVDRFGGPIWYLRSGGLGEEPVVVSAGKDGRTADGFEFGDSDDLRSDSN